MYEYPSISTCIAGLKSDDPLSPAYTPTIFSFTPPPKKRTAEQSLERYEAVKRRREEKLKMEAANTLLTFAEQDDTVVCPQNTVSVACQTDLTTEDMTALEEDYQRKTDELSGTRVAKGYPDENDLKCNEKLLRFYTGLGSFTVLMALFRLVSVAILEGGAAKLNKFQCFILVLMKLRLHCSNYDLGFRFGISESTVS